MSDVNYPFSLNEADIVEVLEVLEDIYCPSPGLEQFIKRMKAIKEKASEKRFEEWGKMLEEHSSDE